MTTTVRPATVGDAAAIVALNAHVQTIHADAHPWRYKRPGTAPLSTEDAEALISAPHLFTFVAEHHDIAVGYINVEIQRHAETPYLHAHEMLYVHHVVVAPNARGRGIGAALMDAAKAHGVHQGVTLMGLTVWSFNDRARQFFRHYGLIAYNERLWNKID